MSKTVEVTPERLGSLPKWALDHIFRLERERDAACKHLRETLDKATPSKVYSETYNTGEFTKNYFQFDNTVRVEHAGLRLEIRLGDDKEIFLSWEDITDWCEAALIPSTHQQAVLKIKRNLK